MSLRAAVRRAVARREVPAPVLQPAFGEIMEGAASPVLVAALLVALRTKGETVDEIVAIARALRERAETAPLPDPGHADVDALSAVLARGNPAPYAGTIRLPARGVEVATAVEVGREDECPLQDGDEDEIAVGVVGRDLAAELVDAAPDLPLGEVDRTGSGTV